MSEATPQEIEANRVFGEIVREYRERAGLSQEQVAERMGYSVRQVRELEAGRADHVPHLGPGDPAEGRLADALGVSWRDIEDEHGRRLGAK